MRVGLRNRILRGELSIVIRVESILQVETVQVGATGIDVANLELLRVVRIALNDARIGSLLVFECSPSADLRIPISIVGIGKTQKGMPDKRSLNNVVKLVIARRFLQASLIALARKRLIIDKSSRRLPSTRLLVLDEDKLSIRLGSNRRIEIVRTTLRTLVDKHAIIRRILQPLDVGSHD